MVASIPFASERLQAPAPPPSRRGFYRAMAQKLSPPVVKCTRCGHLRRDVGSIGGRCVRRPDGKRCEGFYLSVVSTTDWQECSTCHATGYENTARCSQCDGDGWIYTRRSQ